MSNQVQSTFDLEDMGVTKTPQATLSNLGVSSVVSASHRSQDQTDTAKQKPPVNHRWFLLIVGPLRSLSSRILLWRFALRFQHARIGLLGLRSGDLFQRHLELPVISKVVRESQRLPKVQRRLADEDV